MTLKLKLAIKINNENMKQVFGREILESTTITLQAPHGEYRKGWWVEEVEDAKAKWLSSFLGIVEVDEEWSD